MLEFKNEEGVSRAIRHFMHQSSSFALDSFEDLANDDRGKGSVFSEQRPVVDEALGEFNDAMVKLSDDINRGSFKVLQMLSLRASETYNTFLRSVATGIYKNVEDDEASTELMVEYLARLQSWNSFDFISRSQEGQAERLQRLIDNPVFSSWYSAFSVDDWQESLILVDQEDFIERETTREMYRVAESATGVSDDEFVATIESTILPAVQDKLYGDLSESLKYHAQRLLKDNDDLQVLLSTIPTVVEKKIKRLSKKLSAMIVEVADMNLENVRSVDPDERIAF